MNESTIVQPRVFRLPRRAMIGAGVLVGLRALVIVWLVMRKPPPVRARSIGARLELAAGDVAVTEGATPSSKALSGTPLAMGSHIATGPGSRALVRTGDGAAVFLRGETEIALGAHFAIRVGARSVRAARLARSSRAPRSRAAADHDRAGRGVRPRPLCGRARRAAVRRANDPATHRRFAPRGCGVARSLRHHATLRG